MLCLRVADVPQQIDSKPNSDTALIYHGQAASLAWSEIRELITDGLADRVSRGQ